MRFEKLPPFGQLLSGPRLSFQFLAINVLHAQLSCELLHLRGLKNHNPGRTQKDLKTAVSRNDVVWCLLAIFTYVHQLFKKRTEMDG